MGIMFDASVLKKYEHSFSTDMCLDRVKVYR